jgi:rfaE bifunctional protein nucleotidyltransferase chain/domain
MQKILEKEDLVLLVSEIRRKGESKDRIVLCHGVFDLVHPGHLEHFRKAKEFGEFLIVSITADKFINKGPNRPYFNQERRADFLAALELVDVVYVENSESALEVINLVRPNFYVKGPDYGTLHKDITGKIFLEKEAVEKHGGQLVFTDGFTSSSTTLINDSLVFQDGPIRKWIRKYKEKISLEETMGWIDQLRTLDVCIVGETIIDAYTSCKPLSKSSKDPILAFHRFTTQKFMGGVLAIADSCANWSRTVLVTTVPGKDFKIHLNEINKKCKYELKLIEQQASPTIVKHRFYDLSSGNRVFEYYDFNPESISETTQQKILESIDHQLKSNSLLLVADYGHGFFADGLIKHLCESKAFLAVNAQANAGNRGFNTFSKYSRIDFLSLNGGELELELRKKDLNYEEVVPEIVKEKGCRNAVVTLGGDGLLVFDSNGSVFEAPAFAIKVVDKVGAGDSVLAMASMLSYLNAPKEVIGLLSSVIAAFEVSQLGHKDSLDIIGLKKYVTGLLG